MNPALTLERPLAPVSLHDLRDIDPYAAYEQIRAAGPVTWDAGMRAWLVMSHDDCTFVLRREDLFEEPTGSLPDAARIVGRRDIRSLVDAQHEQMHRAVSHAWRPTLIAPLAMAAVRPLVADRLSRLAPEPSFELFAEFARLLPISVISRVLGLPDADADTLDRAKTWMEAVLAWRHSYGEDPDVRVAAIEATRQLEPLLIDTVRARRDRPEDDGISLLWQVGREIALDWDEQDVMDNAKFMYEGGSETTAFLICTATHRLLEMPAPTRAATLADQGAFALFLEEVLRHSTVVHLRARTATTDVAIAGVRIGAGERVIAVNGAANRDPERWERPATLDPSRPRLFGHLAFNVGPRHCAGSHIARLEATEAILGMFRAFPDLARASEPADTQLIGFVSRAWRPVTLMHAPVSSDVAGMRIIDAPPFPGSRSDQRAPSAHGSYGELRPPA
ncbi:MAG: cytochrome P450 [Chloroflexi bacterium]|nr:cytochrome P450 [Chloroflexota bacterium]